MDNHNWFWNSDGWPAMDKAIEEALVEKNSPRKRKAPETEYIRIKRFRMQRERYGGSP